MSLRVQLALIASLALALPWAGCEYIRQTEQGLRENQRELLELTATSVAAALPATALARSIDAREGALYVATLVREPTLDGYVSDWAPARVPRAALSGAATAQLLAAEYANHLYLYVQMNAGATRLGVVAVDRRGQRLTVSIDPTIRGESVVPIQPQADDGRFARVIVEPAAGVVHVEIRLSTTHVEQGLGLQVDGANGAVLARTFAGDMPPAPIRRSHAIEAQLASFADDGLRLDVVDSRRWLLATAGNVTGIGTTDTQATLLPPRLLRWILAAPAAPATVSVSIEQARGPLIDAVLAGQVDSTRVATDNPLSADVVAVAPIRRNDAVHGAVIATQRSAAELLLGNAALQRLALITLALTVATVFLLAGYAAWLSLRIRRLAGAADAALDVRGRLNATMPGNGAPDEIGDLARSVESLLSRVREHNDYLQALAGRLSHELSTPLSVVSSSLDNLDAAPLAAHQREFTDRARDGIERLRAVLAAMREANRIDDLVANATYSPIDLAALVAGVADGYRGAYPTHRFALQSVAGPISVLAAPALVVQLIDKLVDNATSFAPQQSTIELALVRRGAAAVVSVSNDGPTLSDEQLASIFGSLVSYRHGASQAHLGFGLYIAQLIAFGHGGSLTAHNRADGSGVQFEWLLPIDTTPTPTQPAARRGHA